jgi:CRISPR system Cascade subunit CasB
MQQQQTEAKAQTPMKLPSAIGRIAAVIGNDEFPTGDRAALRRLDPDTEAPLAFYRFAFRHLPENWAAHKRAWMTICAGIAIMQPHAHQPNAPAGRALAEAGYSEARLERLLGASGTVLDTLVLRAARLLAAKGSAANWTDFARLLLTSAPDKREAIRMQFARHFYQAPQSKD